MYLVMLYVRSPQFLVQQFRISRLFEVSTKWLVIYHSQEARSTYVPRWLELNMTPGETFFFLPKFSCSSALCWFQLSTNSIMNRSHMVPCLVFQAASFPLLSSSQKSFGWFNFLSLSLNSVIMLLNGWLRKLNSRCSWKFCVWYIDLHLKCLFFIFFVCWSYFPFSYWRQETMVDALLQLQVNFPRFFLVY